MNKPMADQTTRFRCRLWLVALIGVIVRRRVRADWKQEWEAELRNQEALCTEWDRLKLANETGTVFAQPRRVLGCNVAAATKIGGRDVSRRALRVANVAEET